MKKLVDKIVFYDGDCGFCNKSVQYILKYERDHSIYFTALQSDFTKTYFTKRGLELPNMDSIVFLEKENLLTKSAAAFQIAKHFKFPFRLIGLFRVLPEWILDQVYDWIAKNRKRLVRDYCVIPNSQQKKRFLS